MRKRAVLLAILVLAFLLRTIFLSNFPAGFNADEAALGYTAYSLLKTGKDEWGVKWPLNPRSVGDYKLPLYIYLTVPSIAVFGLNELAVRLPSAVMGTLAVLAVYLLTKELFAMKLVSLLASFFLAISPWHISLSRGAFETSLTVCLLPLGIWLFLRGLKKPSFLPVAASVFGLNLFSYHGPRLLVPLLVILLLAFYRRKISFSWPAKIAIAIFGFFCLVAFGAFIFGGRTRVADTSIFKQPGNWAALSDRQYEAAFRRLPVGLERLFNNKATFLVNKLAKNYLRYFSFDYLFTDGVSESTYGMIPGRGVLYFFDLLLVLLAIWQIIKKKDKTGWFLLCLLLLSPFPAALANDGKAGNRASTMLPFWQMLSALGAAGLTFLVKEKFKRFYLIFLAGGTLIILIFLAIFLEDYFFHAPTQNAPFMAYPWRELGQYLADNEKNYQKIVISKRFSEPQTMIAFYLKIDPSFFQSQSGNWLDYEKKGLLFVDQLPEYRLGKFEFRSFHFPEDARSGSLFIGKEEDFFGIKGEVKKIIYFPDPWERIAAKMMVFNPEVK